jgi:predicted nucleic acid-binding protein
MTRILVDTSVWSLALRKKERSQSEEILISRLSEIIRDIQLVMIGPIRQEILSGISDKTKFEELKDKISIFRDFEIHTRDYELAAVFYNECRRNGVQGSHIDFLICAVAHNNGLKILSLDNDFRNYQEYIGIDLEETRSV